MGYLNADSSGHLADLSPRMRDWFTARETAIGKFVTITLFEMLESHCFLPGW
jgi:hypothetical protein